MQGDPRARFAEQLREVRSLAGGLSLSALAKCSPVLTTSVLSTVLRGEFTRAPRWEVVWALVTACRTLGADQFGNLPRGLRDLSAEQVWRDRHRALVEVLEMHKTIPAAADNTASHLPVAPAPQAGPTHLVGNMGSQAPVDQMVQAHTINGGVHQYHQTSRPVVALPYRWGTVPLRAGAFQDRDAARMIEGALGYGDAVVLTSDGPATTSVLSGLGGVGKTQLAVDYAERQWDAHEIDLLVWVTTGSREAIVSSYAGLAADLTGVEDADPEQGARRLLGWLASSTARWLVVLDDVQSPRDVRDWWPPHSPTGRVVVTTRRRDAALRGHRRRVVEVGVFSEAEALAYLEEALAGQAHLIDGAARLAAELGLLPVALAQAAAYTLDRALTCAEYRVLVTDRQRTLASVLPDPEGLPDQHEQTVAATWSLSIEHANRLPPIGLAGVVLEVASVLDPNGIPVEVFTAPAVLSLLAERTGREVSADQAREGLACLHRLSLITLDARSPARAVRVHGLVQRVTRENQSDEALPALVRLTADALWEVWPEVERDPQLAQVLRANTDAVAVAGGDRMWEPDGHEVLFRAGNSLGEVGLVAEAVDYFQRLYATATRCLGPDHPDTLTTRHNLARWRGQAGDPAGAATAFEALLTDQLRVLGPDHPSTLTTRSSIAYWRGEAGDLAGAAAALEELLTDRLRVLGSDHPDTLTTRHNIARSRGQAGDPAGAAAALEELLTDRLRILGSDHPHTLTTRHNLARWRGQAGDPAGAAAAFEALLTDQLRVLGPDHPSTLTTRHEIAYWRGEAGDLAGATAAFEELLTDELRVLGPDHPHTLITRHNIAGGRGQAGDPAGATAALEELLTDRLRILGPDHPHTLTTRHNLAHWRGQAGDPAWSAAAFEALLTDQLRVLGPDHPSTLTTRHNIAHWRGQAGDPAGAVTAFEELLADRLRVLGPDHPHTLTTRNNLAYWRNRLDREDG
ncbi:FxSxx-COOH system tetratricopeptide repeat protein [Kutzneria buriramensis]|uniref:Tetratricopeptide repeat protein n=1 Tax=Kutzneria buriramensis TaxID=1045776 RepID=A0A3E0GTC2_9PSEU|nr:FxSxx-COOH system tetratricopeptide repeat protein [Kutzneria buriramensis]REH25974.1 tetratricopeptide repeat protein [Kutzneria buriramensis]